jgi:hypothetical protein
MLSVRQAAHGMNKSATLDKTHRPMEGCGLRQSGCKAVEGLASYSGRLPFEKVRIRHPDHIKPEELPRFAVRLLIRHLESRITKRPNELITEQRALLYSRVIIAVVLCRKDGCW